LRLASRRWSKHNRKEEIVDGGKFAGENLRKIRQVPGREGEIQAHACTDEMLEK
jgi:hypothetical protein